MEKEAIRHGIEMAIVNAAQVLAVDCSGLKNLRGDSLRGPLVIPDGAVAIGGGTILWTGSSRDLAALLPTDRPMRLIDARGCLVTPGLIDSHTHLIFGGTREDEFESRIAGISYQEIARAGGGIKRTVRQTRLAGFEQLFQAGLNRLDQMLALGVTTVEVKSGYGLDHSTELKMLRVARRLNEEHHVDLVMTFLGAHEFPPECTREDYVDAIVDEMIPTVAAESLAEFCDVFMEKGVFTAAETRRILTAANRAGLKLKLHADQMSDGGGAALAVELGAISADHLNYPNPAGIAALAGSDCVATLLPGSDFFLGLDVYPPARAMIDAGVAVSLATDFNPGSCMTFNLPLIMTIACTQLRMTPAEAFAAVTLNAAAAIDRSDRIGSLAPGKQADLVIFECPNYQMVSYHFGVNHARTVIKRGSIVVGTPGETTTAEFLRQYPTGQE